MELRMRMAAKKTVLTMALTLATVPGRGPSGGVEARRGGHTGGER